MLRSIAKCVLLVGALLCGALAAVGGLGLAAALVLPLLGIAVGGAALIVADLATRVAMAAALVVLTGFLCCLGLVAWRVMGRQSPRRTAALRHEDVRSVQEIYVGLSRLGDRVESLETVLLEMAGKARVDRQDRRRSRRLVAIK